MRVLIVCGGNTIGTLPDQPNSFEKKQPFIHEQMVALQKLGVEFDIFLIKQKGLKGYLKSWKLLLEKLSNNNFDLIHAIYGLSGFLSILQFKCPVVITFLGCDINVWNIRIISRFAMIRSSHNIFVSEMLRKKSLVKSDSTVIPFGIDLSKMSVINKHDARAIMNLEKDQNICLFSSKKERFEKNYSLAEKAVNISDNTKLMELTGQHTKEEVNIIINASDCVLLTSFREGSPQIIKEAMACGCPIVSTDVGDVKKIIGDTKGCFIVSYDPHDVADKIIKAIDFSGKTNGRQRIKMLGLDANTIAYKVKNVYEKVLNF